VDIDAGQAQQHLLGRFGGRQRFRCGLGKQGPTAGKFGMSAPVTEQPVMADAYEALYALQRIKGFRRARNFGFLHPNSKRLIGLLQYLSGVDPNRALAWMKPRPRLQCPCCGASMKIVKTRIPPRLTRLAPVPIRYAPKAAVM